jgi:hypothetical protein
MALLSFLWSYCVANILYDPDPLIAWCREQKAILERQIQMLSDGDMHTSSRTLTAGHQDTTRESLTEARRKLSELNQLLAGSEPARFQGQVRT